MMIDNSQTRTAEVLTHIFYNNFVAYFRAHAAHVNIVGRNFASDHKLLQKTYEDLQEQIDRIGELLRTLGAYMPCDFAEIAAMTTLPTDPIEGDSEELIQLVTDDLQVLVDDFRELITAAEEDTFRDIENYAEDRVLALEKHLWMQRATLS
jgi:starvation-inducible DNA-binding protein